MPTYRCTATTVEQVIAEAEFRGEQVTVVAPIRHSTELLVVTAGPRRPESRIGWQVSSGGGGGGGATKWNPATSGGSVG